MSYSSEDIAHFQTLYRRHYGKDLTAGEAEKRLDALVRLLRLVREVPAQKPSSTIPMDLKMKKDSKIPPNGSLSEPK